MSSTIEDELQRCTQVLTYTPNPELIFSRDSAGNTANNFNNNQSNSPFMLTPQPSPHLIQALHQPPPPCQTSISPQLVPQPIQQSNQFQPIVPNNSNHNYQQLAPTSVQQAVGGQQAYLLYNQPPLQRPIQKQHQQPNVFQNNYQPPFNQQQIPQQRVQFESYPCQNNQNMAALIHQRNGQPPIYRYPVQQLPPQRINTNIHVPTSQVGSTHINLPNHSPSPILTPPISQNPQHQQQQLQFSLQNQPQQSVTYQFVRASNPSTVSVSNVPVNNLSNVQINGTRQQTHSGRGRPRSRNGTCVPRHAANSTIPNLNIDLPINNVHNSLPVISNSILNEILDAGPTCLDKSCVSSTTIANNVPKTSDFSHQTQPESYNKACQVDSQKEMVHKLLSATVTMVDHDTQTEEYSSTPVKPLMVDRSCSPIIFPQLDNPEKATELTIAPVETCKQHALVRRKITPKRKREGKQDIEVVETVYVNDEDEEEIDVIQ